MLSETCSIFIVKFRGRTKRRDVLTSSDFVQDPQFLYILGSLDSLFDQENEKNEPEAESFGASLTVDDIQKAPADPAKLKLNLPSLEMRKVHMTNLEDPWNFYFRVLDIGGNDPITDVEFELQVATSEGILTRFDSLEEIISCK